PRPPSCAPGVSWRRARRVVGPAATPVAGLAATRENTNFRGPPAEKVRTAEPLDGPTCRRFAELAGRLGIHLLLGSFNERSDDPGLRPNTNLLFGPAGSGLGDHRKIHLFDVSVSVCYSIRELLWDRDR